MGKFFPAKCIYLAYGATARRCGLPVAGLNSRDIIYKLLRLKPANEKSSYGRKRLLSIKFNGYILRYKKKVKEWL